MKLDVRLPMGVLFAIIGMLLLLCGVTGKDGVAFSLDIKWGAAMLLFGAACLFLSLKGSIFRKKAQ